MNGIIRGDALAELRKLPDESVNCCVTSPPYWGLRDYGVKGQLGLEKTPEEYVAHPVEVFREVRRVLRKDGTLWLNLGDTYNNCDKWGGGGANTGKHTKAPDGTVESWKAVRRKWAKIDGLKTKDLVGIPWRVAFALQADGWWLRQDIIWAKPNPMPESVRDRCTKAHEYIFLLSKSSSYFYDAEAVREENQDKYNGQRGTTESRKKLQSAMRDFSDKEEMDRYSTQGRNKRSVWTIATKPFPEAHFATFPPEIPELCIRAGCPKGGVVLDPFFGAGTTGLVALRLGREFIGIELNHVYCGIARKRIYGTLGMGPC